MDAPSGSRSAVIDVGRLVKTFGRTTVLNELNLSVAPGEVHGFLGPNGAGKTTRLRILAALAVGGVTAVTSRPPTLERLFLRHYQKAQP